MCIAHVSATPVLHLYFSPCTTSKTPNMYYRCGISVDNVNNGQCTCTTDVLLVYVTFEVHSWSSCFWPSYCKHTDICITIHLTFYVAFELDLFVFWGVGGGGKLCPRQYLMNPPLVGHVHSDHTYGTNGLFLINPGKDSKYDVTSENWELGFALLYQAFVDS